MKETDIIRGGNKISVATGRLSWITPEQILNARRNVASYSKDGAEAKELLAMLGLIE